MPTLFIGVDGGLSGAIAFLVPGESLNVIDIPKHTRYLADGGERSEVDVPKLRHEILQRVQGAEYACALIERGQGDRKQSSHFAFTYGFASGEVSATVKSLVPSSGFIDANIWKRYFGLIGKDKEESRVRATSLFLGDYLWPNKGHHNRAEAALIAAYLAGHGLPEERPAPKPKRKTKPSSILVVDG